jgi:RHS repeat-associated protein
LDIGSKLEARSNWQTAGGVGGLLMTLYPSSAGVPNLPNFVVQGPIMDHMGNVTSVLRMDSSAGLAQLRPEFLYDYDAFGKEIRSTALIAGSNPDSYPFRFSTKYTDGETGLVYYGYRFYDPVNGRWINRDPIAEMGGLNLYGMVGNNAVNLFDVLGNGDVEVSDFNTVSFEESRSSGQSLGKLDSSSGKVTLNKSIADRLGMDEIDQKTLKKHEGEKNTEDFLKALRKDTSFGLSEIGCGCAELQKLLEMVKGGFEELQDVVEGTPLKEKQKSGDLSIIGIKGEGVTALGKKQLSQDQQNVINHLEKDKKFNEQKGACGHPSRMTPSDEKRWAAEEQSRLRLVFEAIKRELRARGCPP